MRFFILSSLLSLALGSSDVAQSERGLGIYDYQVLQMGIDLIEGSMDAFKFTAFHGRGDSPDDSAWAGNRYLYLFKQCPHGAGPDQAKAGDDNFLGRINTFANGETGTATANWIERVEEINTDPVYEDLVWKSHIGFKVLPAALDVDGITTTLTTGDPSTVVREGCDGEDCAPLAEVEKHVVEFCLLFGLGPGDAAEYPSDCEGDCDFPDDVHEVYGFREIILKAEFTMDGNFVCTTFETQAYDPTTGDEVTKKHYQAVANNCSPLDPVRPGAPVCIEVCANTGEDSTRDVFIDLINNMFFCETSEPDTSAPDETFVLVGDINGGASDNPYMYPMLEVHCDDENGFFGDEQWWRKRNWKDGVVGFGCCRTTVTLPARYFATVGGDGNDIFNPTDPKKAQFSVCGDVDIMPMPDRLAQWGPKGPDGDKRGKCTRRGKCWKKLKDDEEEGERRLQTSETTYAENGAISGDLEYTLLPAEESSGKTTIAAGAAVVGALGAALLI